MTAPMQPTADPSLSDADYWEMLVSHGTPKDVATRIVQARNGQGGGALPQHGAVRTALDNFANTTLYGLGTKLSAAASSIAHSGGHDLSLYRMYLDALQQQQHANAAAHPVAAVAGGLTGAVASPLNKLLPVGGAGVGGIAARGAVGGAIAGGVSGAGDAPYGAALSGAAKGAAIGGALGGLLPGGIAAARTAFSPPLAAASRLAGVVKAAGGADVLNAEAQRLAGLGRGNETMLADLSPKLGALADQVATTSDDARNVIHTATAARQAEQSQRVLGDVRAGLQRAEPSVAVRQAALESSRRAWADQAYSSLRDNNPSVSAPEFQAAAGNLLAQPKIARIWKEARDVGLIGTLPDEAAQAMKSWEQAAPAARKAVEEYQANLRQLVEQGIPEAKARAALGAEPTVPGMPAPSFDMLHTMKQMLDDAASAAFRQGRGSLMTRLNSAKGAVDGFLANNVEGYAATNAEYARRLGLEQALQDGAEAWGKNDIKGLAQQLRGMTPDQIDEFRTGMAAKLVEQLSGAKSNRDVATALTNAGQAEQAKLRVVFGDRATFERFMQQQAAERQLSALKGATTGSPTARRLNAGANAIASALGGAGIYAHNPALAAGALVTKGAQMAAQRAMMGQANALAPMLTTAGPAAIQRLLAEIAARRAATLSPALQQGLAGGAGVAGGLLAP